jgi:SAM-dependent methyltransferase
MDYNNYSAVWNSKKSSENHYAHKYLEKPVMYELINDIAGKSIIDIGCGSGEDIKVLKQKNSVIGLDNSEQLLQMAGFENSEIEFIHLDLNKESLPKNLKVDIIYSSLTFHYVKDWDRLFQEMYEILNENGKVIFSTHHPIKWGSRVDKNKQFNQFLMGYKKNKDDKKSFEIYGNYLNVYETKELLFQQLEITHYNRPLSEMFRIFIDNGFQVNKFIEPKPTIESKKKVPDFYEVHSKIPLFVIWELEKISIK